MKNELSILKVALSPCEEGKWLLLKDFTVKVDEKETDKQKQPIHIYMLNNV